MFCLYRLAKFFNFKILFFGRTGRTRISVFTCFAWAAVWQWNTARPPFPQSPPPSPPSAHNEIIKVLLLCMFILTIKWVLHTPFSSQNHLFHQKIKNTEKYLKKYLVKFMIIPKHCIGMLSVSYREDPGSNPGKGENY